jgi:hypothetical protein
LRRKLKGRAIIIGILLIPPNVLWTGYMEMVVGKGFPTTMSLFFNAVFTLLILVLYNLLVGRISPRCKLTQGELMLIYSMVAIGTCMVGVDLYAVLIPCLVHPFWFATPENKWESLFFKYLPKWLMVSDRRALEGYFLGWSTIYSKENILAWLPPILYWALFFMVMIFVMLCINVIFRKQWSENERLTFPIIQLPLAITDEKLSLFKSKLMWMGFAVSALIDIVNNINANYPFFPHIPIRDYDLYTFVYALHPWNAIGWTPIHFFPCIIGLGYLLPLDLSFSCWFFYWYWKFQRVFSVAFNLQVARPDMPYVNDQSAGAYIGIAFFVIWVGRKYLIEVIKRALGMKSLVSDFDEPMSYRTAFIGIVLGFAFLLFFVTKMGARPITAFLFLAIYFILSVAIARIRAELGSPVHDLHFAGPDQMLPRVAGVESFTKGDLVFFTLSWSFNRAYRAHPMPHQLEGFKIAERLGLGYRQYMVAMLIASLIGSFSAFWALLQADYKFGAASAKMPPWIVGFGWEAYNRLDSWLKMPQHRDNFCAIFTFWGFLFSVFLVFMKGRYLWWPFHPVGYAVSSSWAMGLMWCPIFIAWLVKFIVLKSSGLKGFRYTLPFFLGLILGEFVVSSIANILGIIFNWQIYRFWG